MRRIWSYPELLLIALFLVVPPVLVFSWRGNTVPILVKLLLGYGIAFAIWLIIILLVVWPRYRR